MTIETTGESTKRVLEPIDRISEVLFGLIMVLTFTGSLSAAESGQAEVHMMLVGAIGCNVAWGLIDAIMYLMGCLSDRAADIRTASAIRSSRNPDDAGVAIAAALPPVVASALEPADLRRIHAKVMQDLPSLDHPRLHWDDWLGAIAVFLLVFVSTIPVVLPFLFLSDAVVAIRVSNAIAIAMMFATGYAFGRVAGYRPLLMGGSMVLLGAVLVALTIALGG
jgi:VIT1/CCC1 family predicted Fe2+/Mn2+ transporter